MTADTRTTRPGALALGTLTDLAFRRDFCGDDSTTLPRVLKARSERSAAALADLRALLARCEAAERERDAAKRHAETLAAHLQRFADLAGDVSDRHLWPTLGPLAGDSRAALATYRAERGK